MRAIFLILISLSTLFSKTLDIGVVPYKSPENLLKIYKPFIEYLEKNSEYKVNLHFPKDYNGILDLIKKNQLDIAAITSYMYVKNRKYINNKTKYMATTLRNIKGLITWYYYSYIITRKDTNINSLKELRNRSFAFTDINSTSGFLYPKNMLLQEGIAYKKDLSKHYFLKKHNRVIKALMQNSIDAVGTYDRVVYEAQENYPNKIKILAKSVPIPLESFFSTKRLSKEEHKKLTKLLLNYLYLKGDDFIAGFVDVDKSVFDDIKRLISLK